MECAYKTNMYQFPIMEIVGVTSTNLMFFVAFGFLEYEKQKNYLCILDKV